MAMRTKEPPTGLEDGKMRISKDIPPGFIIAFLVVVHCLTLLLCIKWYGDFAAKAFDPGVIILFGMAACSIAAIDYGIFRSQILLRETLRFHGSAEGLCIYGAFRRKTVLRWEDIAFYGTLCDRPGCMVLFFSTNKTKLPRSKDYAGITQDNIVIQFRPETWDEIQKWIPHGMKKKMERAVGSGRSSLFGADK